MGAEGGAITDSLFAGAASIGELPSLPFAFENGHPLVQAIVSPAPGEKQVSSFL